MAVHFGVYAVTSFLPSQGQVNTIFEKEAGKSRNYLLFFEISVLIIVPCPEVFPETFEAAIVPVGP